MVKCLPDMLMAVVEAMPLEKTLWSQKGLYLFENSIAETTPPAFLPFWLSTQLGCKAEPGCNSNILPTGAAVAHLMYRS